MSEGPKILLAFDGTDQASHAIEYAARYLRAGIVEPVSYTHLTLPTTPYV